jgi:hypothetical protein
MFGAFLAAGLDRHGTDRAALDAEVRDLARHLLDPRA